MIYSDEVEEEDEGEEEEERNEKEICKFELCERSNGHHC